MRLTPLIVFMTVLLAIGDAEAADSPTVGDEGAMPPRLSHQQALALSQDELIAHGRRLFLAKFTREEGVGRPAATGAARPDR